MLKRNQRLLIGGAVGLLASGVAIRILRKRFGSDRRDGVNRLRVGLIESDRLSDPQAVLEYLKKRRQSAIVIRFPDSLRLVYRGALIEMIYRGATEIDPKKLHYVEDDPDLVQALVAEWSIAEKFPDDLAEKFRDRKRKTEDWVNEQKVKGAVSEVVGEIVVGEGGKVGLPSQTPGDHSRLKADAWSGRRAERATNSSPTSMTDYAFHGVSNGLADISVRSLKKLELIKTTGGYRCNGVEVHGFPEPKVRVGNACPEFGCLTEDGSESVIIAL